MQTTHVDPDGTVRCPKCGATSFTEKRTGKAKWGAGVAGVATLGVGGVLGIAAAPKRLKCNGCGTNLRRSGGNSSWVGTLGASEQPGPDLIDEPAGPTALERIDKWTSNLQDQNAQNNAKVEDAKSREVGYLPEGVHPKSIRARQIRRAQEKRAQIQSANDTFNGTD